MKFADRIHAMNTMYKLPIESLPTVPHDVGIRLANFKKTLVDEINEIDDIMSAAEGNGDDFTPDADIATMIADLLADITVYCRSEALKYGIPLEHVLDIVMDSNESKLGADGKPIYNENGKFMKGPNYWKPEPKIRELLVAAVQS